jgi:activator of HSP90 ATPase
MKTTTFHQSVTFNAAKRDSYETLMDCELSAWFTGCAASIGRDLGGPFAAIRGTNVELVPDRKIVQSWKCAADSWSADYFPTLTVQLEFDGSATRLVLDHAEGLEACAPHMDALAQILLGAAAAAV